MLKSKVKWLQVGDRNTSYFHMVASCRRRLNVITPAMVGPSENTSVVTLESIVSEVLKGGLGLEIRCMWRGGMRGSRAWSEERQISLRLHFSEDEIR